jgi:PBSX family phage terminase large subunit
MDDPAKIKSVNNPTHAWVEEANALEQDDYDTLTTTLRTNTGRVQEWLSFNPECEDHYEDFWMVKKWPLLKEYQTGTGELIAKLKSGKEVKLTYTSTWTTYRDNPYCSEERIAKMELLAANNPVYSDVFCDGKWGRKLNESPAAFSFNREKHIGSTEWKQSELTIVSCDFNRNPMCWSIFQIIDGHIYGIETIKMNNSGTPAMCDYLKAQYRHALFIVTGDASGDNGTTLTNDHISNYTVIRQQLGLSDAQLKVPKKNPKVKDNINLFNMVLSQVECTFDPQRCKHLIYDFENVRLMPAGDLDKSDRKNPNKQADALDTWRYFCNTFFSHLLK